ncbi:hypothetical protein KHP62_13740 [Rhodobacteraceae bacterium NNCM2]|nr:hypothetical protein [Coraliihabitans acroporae]
MKLRFRNLAFAAGLAVVGGTASQAVEESNFMVDTTADLAALCAAQPGDANYSAAIHMCQGYILGVHHFHTALAMKMDTDVYCVAPDETAPTRDEVMATFVTWVGAHPEIAQTEALDGLLTWASEAHPCS